MIVEQDERRRTGCRRSAEHFSRMNDAGVDRAEDAYAPVERVRATVQQLRAAGADVRYTEYPVKGHWLQEVYTEKALFDWLAARRKSQ